MNSRGSRRMNLGVAASAFMLAIAAAITAGSGGARSAERNPPGDIPDDQVFVSYASPDGYVVKVPEGWARTTATHRASFADKYGSITLEATAAAQAPTPASARATQVPIIERESRAARVKSVASVKLTAGDAVLIAYEADSEPSSVTGRRLRRDHERFIFFRQGQAVSLDLGAPVGADNADQWQLIANSFRWK